MIADLLLPAMRFVHTVHEGLATGLGGEARRVSNELGTGENYN